jgi:hypothetical protein
LNGSTMLDPKGAPIMLRGINEGTWGEMRSYDAQDIKAKGANVVRVLIRWWGKYDDEGTVNSRKDPSPGHFKPDHLEQFLKELKWCRDAGLWVVPAIDSDCGQGSLDEDTLDYCRVEPKPDGDYLDGRNFWTDLSQRELFKEAWVYLASILKDYDNVAFYELLPEPLSKKEKKYADDVSAFYQELMTAIEDRAGDKRTPFLIGPRDGYNIEICDEAYIDKPRWTNRVVYTGNLFVFTGQDDPADNIKNLTRRLRALWDMKNDRNVPVFIQQFGVEIGKDPGQVYLDAGLSRMNAAGIGYTGWQWRQNTDNQDQFAIVVEKDVNGSGRENDIVNEPVLAVYSKYWTEKVTPLTSGAKHTG